MSCVLRAYGAEFDVDDFLRNSPFKALVVVHRGDKRAHGSKLSDLRYDRSGVNISVSTCDFSDLTGQIKDATQFLNDNAQELRRLRDLPGVEGIDLDFPVEERDVIFQRDAFPPHLLAHMGELRIGLVVSRYPAPDSGQS